MVGHSHTSESAKVSQSKLRIRQSSIYWTLTGIALSLLVVVIVIGVLFAQQGQDIKNLSREISALKEPYHPSTTNVHIGQTELTTVPTAPVETSSTPATERPDLVIRDSYRLPGDIIPTRYDVQLKVYLPIDDTVNITEKSFTTGGNVIMQFLCNNATNHVIIHVWNITVNEEDVVVCDSEGTSYLAVTQFQAHKARRMFPCLDEPAFRAIFKFTIQHDSRHSAYSVRRIEHSRVLPDIDENGVLWRETIFEDTIRMPSYLLAFLISDFARTPGITAEGVDFGVLARPNALTEADFALKAGINMTDFAGSLFGMSYKESNSKLDMVAIPHLWPGGVAMENFGLITYGELYMLYKKGISTAEARAVIAQLVAHELAHQWFGNVVTCEWWSDIFLNEGLAQYIATPLVQHFKPEWEREKLLFTMPHTGRLSALTLDALDVSVPLVNPTIQSARDLEVMFGRFGSVIYDKGSSVLRMIEFTLSKGNFYAALTTYLRERVNHGGSTTYPLLFRAFTDQMRKVTIPSSAVPDYLERFEEWITTTGYPLVTVRRGIIEGHFIATQERFLSGSGPFEDDVSKRAWNIPLTYIVKMVSDNTESLKAKQSTMFNRAWFNKGDPIFHFPVSLNAEWILANVQSSGFYRVNYDDANWNALAQQLKGDHEAIHLNSRVQLIEDALELAKKGLVHYETAMKILSYIVKERETPPWMAVSSGLAVLDGKTRATPPNHLLSDAALKLFSAKYSADPMFWNTSDEWVDDVREDYQELNRRIVIVEGACYYGLSACHDQALIEFKKWKAANSDDVLIDPNFKSSIYCYAVRHGGTSEFEYLHEQYEKDDFRATSLASKTALIFGMGCTNDHSLLRRFLLLGLAQPVDQARIFFMAAVKFADSHDIVYKLMQNLWSTIPAGMHEMVIRIICDKFNTQAQIDDVNRFMESLGPNSPVKHHFEESLGVIQGNINWGSTYNPALQHAIQTVLLDDGSILSNM